MWSVVRIFALSAVVCSASALSDLLLSGLKRREAERAVRGTGMFAALEHVQRAIPDLRQRALTADEKCDRLTQAFKGIIAAVQGNLQETEVKKIRDQLLSSTGMDMYDPEHVRQEACKTARISSIADFARRAGIPESTMRQFYPAFVQTMNQVRSMLRSSLNSTYLPRNSRALVASVLYFYDTLDDIGLLSLH